MSRSSWPGAILTNSRRARRSQQGRHTLRRGSPLCLESGHGELGDEGGLAAEPAELGSDAFEERVQGQSRSFHAGDFDDFVDPSWEEAALAALEAARAVAVDDDVDLAKPVECLFGFDA